MNAKPFWRSKTIWLMTALIAASGLPEVRALVPEEWLVPVVGIAAIVLRLVTRQPVTVRL